MKRRTLIIVIVCVVLLTWFGTSILNVYQAKNRDGVFLSPDRSRSVEFVSLAGTSQLLMNFHKSLTVGGGNIVSGDFNENDIELEWKGDDTLIIQYPQSLQLQNKEDEIYFFNEKVKVEYRELRD